LNLTARDATVDLGILSFADMASWMVLSHQVDVGVSAQFAGDPLHDLGCPRHTARHDEVTQKNTTQSYTMLIGDERADLTVHLPDDPSSSLRVVRSFRVTPRLCWINERPWSFSIASPIDLQSASHRRHN
jgi:hypothetical protein